jgi:hypothetical protein
MIISKLNGLIKDLVKIVNKDHPVQDLARIVRKVLLVVGHLAILRVDTI